MGGTQQTQSDQRIHRARWSDVPRGLWPDSLPQLFDVVQPATRREPGERYDRRANEGTPDRGGSALQAPGKNPMLNAAVYQIKQTDVATPNPADPASSTYVQTGEVRSRGFEFSEVGKVTRELSSIAAYVYQDVKNVKANDDSLNKWPVDIPRPRQMASLWADWTWHTRVRADLGFGAGVRYQSLRGRIGQLDLGAELPALRRGCALRDAQLAACGQRDEAVRPPLRGRLSVGQCRHLRQSAHGHRFGEVQLVRQASERRAAPRPGTVGA